MKAKIYHSILTGLLSVGLPFVSMAQTRYFEQEEVFKVSGIKADTQIYMLNNTQKSIVRTFLDGLGRPVQVSAIQASPLQKDIISFQHYNKLGQQDTAYLQYTAADGSGGFHNNALAEQNSFYNNGGAGQIADDSKPFSKQIIENSPLQRLLQAGAAGAGFQPGEHYGSATYRSNTASTDGSIILWLPDGTRSGSYSDHTLSVTEATGPEGNRVLTFTDRSGHAVLQRQKLNSTTNIDTYYLYNHAGGLSYTLPPKAVKLLIDNPSYTLTQTGVAALIYTYTYDDKGRLAAKKIPGSGSLYIIYDPLDRPVLLQDANLRAANRWNFIKYDLKGRAVVQGYYTDATHTTAAAMQTYADGMAGSYATTWYESRSNSSSTGYYTNNIFPATGTTLLACSYYDDYDLNYDAGHAADYSYTAQGLSDEATPTSLTRGMLTMSRTRSVGSGMASTWFTKVMFYDKRGNVIQVKTNNQLVTTLSDIATSVPDFSGATLQTKVVKTHAAGTSTIVYSTYSYDHAYRLKSVKQKYNTGTEYTVATYAYNELGQLTDKKLGVTASAFLQSVDYRYNIRGQLLSINNSKLKADTASNDDTNDVFGEELFYNASNAQAGSTGTYDGQLTAVTWMSLDGSGSKSNERSYKYTYDGLNRFTQAIYGERTATSTGSFTLNANGFTEKVTAYDENGNIKGLQRYSSTVNHTGAGTKVDGLKYTYDTNDLNKLLMVSDTTGNDGGFRNYSGNTTGSYTYNAAGSLTADPYKGITAITYNVLGRVDKVTLTYPSPATTGRYIDYTYDASGKLIRKRQYDNNTLINTTDYIDGFVYLNGTLSYFGMPEGRVRNTGSSLKAEYIITDHQGNARISFEDNGSGQAVVVQENSYYAFGMSMTSTMALPTVPNKKLYNGGAEWQNDFADQPDWQQTFYRNYDAAIGRFIAADPVAEATESMTIYQYANNNPVMLNDPMGDISQAYGRIAQQIANEGRTGNLALDYANEALNSSWLDAIDYFRKNNYGDWLRQFGGQTIYSRSDPAGGKIHNNYQLDGFVKSIAKTRFNIKQIEGYSYTYEEVTYSKKDGIFITGKRGFIPFNYANQGGCCKIIDNSWDAVTHYYNGNGQPVRLGAQTVEALLNSNQFKASYNNIKSGRVNTTNGRFNVNLTKSIFHVGRTNVTWSISNVGHDYSVIFNLFVDDGFWDPDFIDERYLKGPAFVPDGKGPNLERFGGTPYDYIPSVVTFKFKRP